MRKAGFDMKKAIELYEEGLSYKEIGLALNSKPDAIRMAIKKYAPELLGDPLDKQEIVKLFSSGFSYKEIATKFNSTSDAVRKVLERNAPEELEKKRQARKVQSKQLFNPKDEEMHLPVVGVLTIDARKEMLNERTWGLNQNEGMSDRSFFNWSRQSFISDKKDNRKYRFDKKRGKIQRDLCTLNL